MKTSCIIVFALFFCICTSFISAKTVYVWEYAVGGLEDGSSWENAYLTIQAGINGADSSDTVLVGGGEYYENLDLDGKAITLTSTDPNDWGIVSTTLIDGSGSGSVITCDSSETVDTKIIGFRIQNGGGNSSNNAGGIYCHNSSPVIQQCVIMENTITGSFGAGIFCYSGAPTIDGCTFLGNIGSNAHGGGIGCYESNATIRNCVFSGNDADRGGGIGCYQCSPDVSNCSFSGNTSSYGGAFYCYKNAPTITNSILWGNSATNGDEVSASASSLSISYSVVEGGWTGAGTNIFTDAPMFIDADGDNDIAGDRDDNLYLDGYSYCINTGDASGSYDGQVDSSGFNRVLYDQVDIGAYEIFPIGGDLDADEQVELADIMMFAESDMWLTEVFLEDFAQLAGQWLYGVD